MDTSGALGASAKAVIWSAAILLGSMISFAYIVDSYDRYRFNHLSSAEHLRIAQDLCHSKQSGAMCLSTTPEEAARHLEKIRSVAPEYGRAQDLLLVIHGQEAALAERQRLAALQESKEQAATAAANPSTPSGDFICSRGHPTTCSKVEDEGPCASRPIISFNNGVTWTWDDGRCAAKEQKQRDSDAELSSYWSTTLRVDTDMDSFWLNNEERTCQTHPDDKGRVAVVACNASGSHRDHNIPVKFWGGVDRNTVSEWKCRREGGDFVCRALD